MHSRSRMAYWAKSWIDRIFFMVCSEQPKDGSICQSMLHRSQMAPHELHLQKCRWSSVWLIWKCSNQQIYIWAKGKRRNLAPIAGVFKGDIKTLLIWGGRGWYEWGRHLALKPSGPPWREHWFGSGWGLKILANFSVQENWAREQDEYVGWEKTYLNKNTLRTFRYLWKGWQWGKVCVCVCCYSLNLPSEPIFQKIWLQNLFSFGESIALITLFLISQW